MGSSKLMENGRKLGVLFIATGGFSGFLPVAPGTFGSIVAILWIWGMGGIAWPLHLLLVLVLGALGVWASDQACKILKRDDAQQVVIDEIVGIFITMIGIPVTPYWLGMGFILFRIFDIWKPPPARYFDEKLEGGWGVMMDDVMAGVYGCILMHLMVRAQF